jgi:hypothetical protein
MLYESGCGSTDIIFRHVSGENDCTGDVHLMNHPGLMSPIVCTAPCRLVNAYGLEVQPSHSDLMLNFTGISIDAETPVPLSVYTSTNQSDTLCPLTAGDEFFIYVKFSLPVTVAGNQLHLLVNTTYSSYAMYHADQSNDTDLAFLYMIEYGQMSLSDITNDYLFGGGLIQTRRDPFATGLLSNIHRKASYPIVNASLKLPQRNNFRLGVGGCNFIEAIETPHVDKIYCHCNDGIYSPGDQIAITIVWTHTVYVEALPKLFLDTGSFVPATAVYLSGSGSKELVFQYTVESGQRSENLDVLDTESLDFTNGKIYRWSMSPTILVNKELPIADDYRSLSSNSNIVIDSRVPYITSIWSPTRSGPLNVDDVVIIIIEFSRRVVVTGAPYLLLAMDNSRYRKAVFSRQPTESSVSFEYIICLGDSSLSLDYWTSETLEASSGISLNGGSIQLRSTQPCVDADISLNPGVGFLFGRIDKKVQNGLVIFDDLTMGSRGLNHIIRFSAQVRSMTLEHSVRVEVERSGEFELRGNLIERRGHDMFGYSTSVSGDVLVIGAPYTSNPLPEIQVISLSDVAIDGENEIFLIETRLLPNDASVQIQSFYSYASEGETIGGNMSITYQDDMSYVVGSPLTVPVNVDPQYLAASLENHFPFLGKLSVSRYKNRLCGCENGWRWDITFHDVLSSGGLLIATGNSLSGEGSALSYTDNSRSDHFISGSFFITRPKETLKSRPIPYNATSSELSSIFHEDLDLCVQSVQAIDSQYDNPSFGRRWLITFSTSGSDIPELVVDGVQLSGKGVSISSSIIKDGQPALGGSFAFSMLDSNFSYYIPYNATCLQVKQALESLESLQQVSVSQQHGEASSSKPHLSWTITFLSVNRLTDYGWIPHYTFNRHLPLLQVKIDKLHGSTLSVHHQSEIDKEGLQSGQVTIFRRVSDSWKREASLLASDNDAYDQFGFSLDISGDFIIVGCPFKGKLSKLGSAYIFELRKNCEVCPEIWTETQKLTPFDVLDDGTEASEFGYSVSLGYNVCRDMVAVVGSPGFKNDLGKVYIFHQMQDEWALDSFVTSEKFTKSSIGDRFGQVVKFYQEQLVVAAPGYGDKRGAVYIFQLDKNCSTFLPSQFIQGQHSQPGDSFGAALSCYNHDMVICAPYHTIKGINEKPVTKAGVCYVYRRVGSNGFQLVQELVASNVKSNDRFGCSIAMSSNKMLIGQVEEFTGELVSQSPVQVIRVYSGTLEGNHKLGAFFRLGWRQAYTRPISSSVTAMLLRTVIEEDLATGTVYVERTGPDIHDGYMWLVTFKAINIFETTFPMFTCDARELSGRDPLCTVNKMNDVSKKIRSKVHLFTLESELWIEQAFLFPRLPQRQDLFGFSVSLDGDFAVVGSPNRESFNINSGSAIVYDVSFADLRFVSSRQSIFEGERVVAEVKRDTAKRPLFIRLRTIDRNAIEKVQHYVNQLFDFRSGEIFPMELTTIDLLEQNTAFGRDQFYGSEEKTSQWVDGMFDYRGISDYSPEDVQLYFDADEKMKTIVIETCNDKIFEAPDERFSVHMSLPGMYASALGKLHMNVTIIDDGDGVGSDEIYYRKVFGSRTVAGDHMGSTIALDTDSGVMLVGNSPDSSNDAGLVYVFRKIGLIWKEETTLIPSLITNSSSFGRSLCIQKRMREGDRLTVMVGTPGQGRAYIYVQSNSTSVWREEAVFESLLEPLITPEHRFAESGAIALDGNVAFVGAAGLEVVFMFRRGSYNHRTELYSWGLWMTLRSSNQDLNGVGAHFGACVAAERRLLLVGAPSGEAGEVYAYYSQPQVLRIAFSFSAEPIGGSFILINGALREFYEENLLTSRLPFDSTTDALESYFTRYVKVGDVSVEVSKKASITYNIMWDVTFWDRYGDSPYPTITPLWKGSGCNDCEEFISSEGKHLFVTFYTEILQNSSIFELEDIIRPSDSSRGDQFGNAVSLDEDNAIIGANSSPAKARTTWDFETGDLIGWSKTGKAFCSQPIATSNIFLKAYKGMEESHRRYKSNARGHFYIDTFYNYDSIDNRFTIQGNGAIGSVTSDPFPVLGDEISFLIGGGCDHLTLYVELLIDGYSTVRATGRCEEVMDRVSWDVREYKQRSGQIRIVDYSSSSWGHIKVDDFNFDWDLQPKSCLAENVDQCANEGGEISGEIPDTFESGAAYIFRRKCGSNNTCFWLEDIRLVASDKRSGDKFGFSVALDNSEGVAIIGSPYSANFGIFKEIPSVYPHFNSSLVDFPLAPNMETLMKSGYTHSPIDGHLRAINHYLFMNHEVIKDTSPFLFNRQSGAVYVYHRKYECEGRGEDSTHSCWRTTESAKLSPPDAFSSDYFGFSIGMDKSIFVSGATGNDSYGGGGGALYFIDQKWQRAQFKQFQYVVLEGADDIVIVHISRDKDFAHQRLHLGYSTSDLSAVGVDETKFRRCSSLSINQREGCGDYEQTSGEVIFEPGDVLASFQVRIVNDLCWERYAEYIHLQLHIPGGIPIQGAGFRAHIRIDDDDWPDKLSTKTDCNNSIW